MDELRHLTEKARIIEAARKKAERDHKIDLIEQAVILLIPELRYRAEQGESELHLRFLSWLHRVGLDRASTPEVDEACRRHGLRAKTVGYHIVIHWGVVNDHE